MSKHEPHEALGGDSPQDEALLEARLDEGWAPFSGALFHAFEDAAEAAKPDLALMQDRIFATLKEQEASALPAKGPFARLLKALQRAQPWILLAATTAALALVVPGLLQSPAEFQSTTELPQPSADALAQIETEELAVAKELADGAQEEESPPLVVVRDLSFGEAQGMVYRTPRGGMTIVWVTESEDA